MEPDQQSHGSSTLSEMTSPPTPVSTPSYHHYTQANAEAGELTRAQLRSRWLVLVMSSMVLFGSFYSYDNPAALHMQLKNQMHEFEDYEIYFNRLYSVCSFPNIFIPFFGGTIVDRLGAPVCSIFFSLLLLIGQITFACGAGMRSWTLMLIGRTVYGLGQENIAIASSVLLADWFVGSRALSLAFGFSLSISRLGSVLNNFISPAVASAVSTPAALWIGVMVNALSVCMSVIIAIVDKDAEERCSDANLFAKKRVDDMLRDLDVKNINIYQDKDDFGPRPELTYEAARHLQRIVDRNSVKWSDILIFGKLFWYLCFSCSVVYGCILPFNNVAQGLLLERDYFQIPSSNCILTFPDQCASGTLQLHANPPVQENSVQCTGTNIAPILPSSLNITDLEDDTYDYSSYIYDPLDIYDVNCNDKFWKYGCAQDFCDSQEEAIGKASRTMSIPYAVSAVISPFLGHAVDRIGYRSQLVTISPLILVFVHVMLGFTKITPVFPLILQGVAFSIFAAVIWPSVPLCVEQRHVGTAYGVMSSAQNIGLTLFPVFVADLHQTGSDRFIPDVEILFIILAIKAVFSGATLVWIDTHMEGILSKGACVSVEKEPVEKIELLETFPSTRVTPLPIDPNTIEQKDEDFVDIDVKVV